MNLKNGAAKIPDGYRERVMHGGPEGCVAIGAARGALFSFVAMWTESGIPEDPTQGPVMDSAGIRERLGWMRTIKSALNEGQDPNPALGAFCAMFTDEPVHVDITDEARFGEFQKTIGMMLGLLARAAQRAEEWEKAMASAEG